MATCMMRMATRMGMAVVFIYNPGQHKSACERNRGSGPRQMCQAGIGLVAVRAVQNELAEKYQKNTKNVDQQVCIVFMCQPTGHKPDKTERYYQQYQNALQSL